MMSTNKQSSLCGMVSVVKAEANAEVAFTKAEDTSAGKSGSGALIAVYCGHAGAAFVALRVANPDGMGCGGFKRSFPIGACAKGMPLKLSTPAEDDPMTVPLVIIAEGPEARSSSAMEQSKVAKMPKANKRRILPSIVRVQVWMVIDVQLTR